MCSYALFVNPSLHVLSLSQPILLQHSLNSSNLEQGSKENWFENKIPLNGVDERKEVTWFTWEKQLPKFKANKICALTIWLVRVWFFLVEPF